jgi:transketolase
MLFKQQGEWMKKLKSGLSIAQVRAEWKSLMDSKHEKMPQGAQNLDKIITSAHKDNWRRKNTKKSKQSKAKK